jgi:exosome complex RNA-binding protein Csl4
MVLPGEIIPPRDGPGPFVSGPGTYTLDGSIYASIAGTPRWEGNEVCVLETIAPSPTGSLGGMNLNTSGFLHFAMLSPTVGSSVHLRVQRVSTSLASGDIIAINGQWCTSTMSFRGSIRLEDVRKVKGTESYLMVNCFRPGDVVIAEVVGLADARQYQLSTVKEHCGVVKATHVLANGVEEIPLQPKRGNREFMFTAAGEAVPRWCPSEGVC